MLVSGFIPQKLTCDGVYPYKNTAIKTIEAPMKKAPLNKTSETIKDETMHDRIIDSDVANPFRILSAYLTTTATI